MHRRICHALHDVHLAARMPRAFLNDNFEEQLIGAHPGDKVEVTVVFPDDYQAADLAGKEAVFDVTVNGIYE